MKSVRVKQADTKRRFPHFRFFGHVARVVFVFDHPFSYLEMAQKRLIPFSAVRQNALLRHVRV